MPIMRRVSEPDDPRCLRRGAGSAAEASGGAAPPAGKVPRGIRRFGSGSGTTTRARPLRTGLASRRAKSCGSFTGVRTLTSLRRHARRCSVNRGLSARILEAVAEAADGGDDVWPQFLADAGDEHFDRVRVAVEILVVNMLD